MREVTTETELVEKEKEVEYVYCDECGNECTGDEQYEVREVCSSCSSMEKETFLSKEKALEKVRSEFDGDIEHDLFLLFIAVLPLFAWVMLSERDALAIFSLYIIVGGAVWALGIAGLIFLFFV